MYVQLLGNAETCLTYNVSLTDSGWTITLNLKSDSDATYTVNGTTTTPTDAGNSEVTLSLTGNTSYEVVVTNAL